MKTDITCSRDSDYCFRDDEDIDDLETRIEMCTFPIIHNSDYLIGRDSHYKKLPMQYTEIFFTCKN